MDGSDYGTSEFLTLFLEENGDRFHELNDQLLLLEKEPTDRETLFSVMRHLHSIKGSAGMFGLSAIRDLAHRMEDLLTFLHANPHHVDAELIDTMFRGTDFLQEMFKRIGSAAPDLMLDDEEKFVHHLDLILQGHELSSEDALVNLLRKLLPGMPDCDEKIQISEALSRYEGAPLPGEVFAPVTGTIHLGETDLTEELRRMDDYLLSVEQGKIDSSAEEVFYEDVKVCLVAARLLNEDELTPLLDDVTESVDIFSQMPGDFDEIQIGYYRDFLEGLKPYLVEESLTEPEGAGEVAFDAEERSDSLEAFASESEKLEKSVRISEAKVDDFLNGIGELIILSEVFSTLHKRATQIPGASGELLREFKSSCLSMNQQILTLQDSLMKIRRVPIRNISVGLSRLVRDSMRAAGKEVELVVEGEEAVIDKSYLDDLQNCLVHLLRNAVDHGIESAEDRIAAGKPPQGMITIAARNADDFLYLNVTDDGKGMDLRRLRELAVERGVLTAAVAPLATPEQVYEVLFTDGVSTAENVTDLSGRGVGLSAVREAINTMNGTIEISSTLGKGTTFALKIPLSVLLSVLDGLVVDAGGIASVLPIQNVKEMMPITPDLVQNVAQRGESVCLRGEIYPLFRLNEIFHVPSNTTETIGVLLETRHEHFCLCVDHVADHQQVVLKQIDGLPEIPGIMGGALLGSGAIGFVLDLDEMLASLRSLTPA